MARSKHYMNLHKSEKDADKRITKRVYSSAEDGTVVHHGSFLILKGVSMKNATKEQGERCKECREVCQWMLAEEWTVPTEGTMDAMTAATAKMRVLGCCPKVGGFADAETGEPVHGAKLVILTDTQVFYA